MASSNPELEYFVDLKRYPIDNLDSAAGRELISMAHAMMSQDCLALLPNFLRADAVGALADELSGLESHAHRIDYLSTPYGWMDNSGFAEEHPRSRLFRRNCGTITTELLESTSLSQRLFHLDELTEFVRRLLGYESLYPSVCPTLSIQVNTMVDGDGFGWHFDTNDGVVSFMIQTADGGGEFEYVPLIRDEDDEHYDDVQRVFDGTYEPLRPNMVAGAFSLFMGRRSVHRVAPVGATGCSRISLLYSYDRQPGMVFPAKTCERITSGANEPYLGALTGTSD